MMKRLLTILSICVLCITAQAQIVIGVTRTGQVGTADQNLEFVDQFGRIMAYPSLGPTGELLDAMRPAVATNLNVSDVTKVSATTGGKVIAEGASAVTECGVCFSTSTNPTTQDAHVTATPDADGNFTVSLTGLQPNTTYHVRAYATNAIGTSYGTDFTFTTRGDANITITGNTDTKTYNGAQQSVTGYTVTIPDGVNIAASEISGPTVTAQGTDVGTYTMSLTAGDFSCSNTNYDVTFTVANGVSLTITRATATVTADAQTKVYGTAEPSFTATVTGLQGNDAASSITYSVTRATGENVGTYAITPSGAAEQGNYNVTYVPANLTITKASATVTPDAKSKTYGAADPELTATVSGTVGSDVLNYTLSRTAGENAGTYDINVNLGDNPNYNVTVVPGTLTITKATATVTADNATKVYGATDPTFTATVTGVQSGDQLNYTLARATGENAGTYDITVTPGSNPNYEVTTANGTFTINKATAIVTAADKSKTYGASDPELTATVTGAVNNETLNYTLSRANGESAGTYAITVTLGSNPNYEVTAANGTFTINKATATVTANNASKVYGATDPTFTATVTGVQGSDQLNYTLARATGENAGTYDITVTLGSNPNYEVTATKGTFTITKATATVTITGNTGSKTYNGREQSVTGYTVSIPSGVSISTDQISYSGTAEAKGTNAGTYNMGLTSSDFSTTNGNYDVTFQVTDGSITINRADATVTADNKTKVAGELDPSFTATVTGLQNGETASVLTYTFSRETGEGVGTYAIKPAGDAQQGNYNVTYVHGTLTITEPACPTMGTTSYTPSTVTASATSITFTTTLNNVASGVTISDATFTVVSDGVANQTLNATYSNDTITATLSGLDNYRDKLIKVTPKVTVSGCSNPGSITGDAVEICVQPTLPSFGTVTNTNGSGKANLFKRQGVYTYVTINNGGNVQILEVGFYISKIKAEVQNHTCSPIVADFSKVDIHNYQGASSAFDEPEYTDNVYNTKVGMSNCGVYTYYQPYMIVSVCGEPITIYGNGVNQFEMWAPEDKNNSSLFTPTVSASPNPVSSGAEVQLDASCWITMGSLGGHHTIPDAFSTYSWALSMLGASGVSTTNWTYRWEDEDGNTIHSSHTTGKKKVYPNQTTTYTAFGEFTYGGETCRVSKSITVTVQ